MEISILSGAQLHAPQNPQAQRRTGLGGLVQAVQRVVVRQRQRLQTPLLCQARQLRGSILSV